MGCNMNHKMKLKRNPFQLIQDGSKTVELRLNDEKRQQVQIGDVIEFTMLDDVTKKLSARVTAIHKYASFDELFAALPKEKLGYKSDETLDPSCMDEYYSKENQIKYGVLGIEIEVIDKQ